MSQQGDKRDYEDNWWRQLYEDGEHRSDDTGPSGGPDSLDTWFDSALHAMDPPAPAEPSEETVSPELGAPFWFGTAPPPPAVPEPPAPPPPPAKPEPPAVPEPPGEKVRGRAPRAGSGRFGKKGSRQAPVAEFVADRPSAYAPEPVALPSGDPADLGDVVADTELEGAQYGTLTLRAASVRGELARFRGEPRRDALLATRFGDGRQTLILIAVANGVPGSAYGHLAARDACRWIAGAVGRSSARLADDLRTDRHDALKSGLQRLTDRGYGKLRERAAERGVDPRDYTASLRCLLLPSDPVCRTRVFFGAGDGGLFRLRDGVWDDLEPPRSGPVAGYGAGSAAPGIPAQRGLGDGPEPTGSDPDQTPSLSPPLSPSLSRSPSPPDGLWGSGPKESGARRGGGDASSASSAPSSPFRFRAAAARPGDMLLLCSTGLAEPLRAAPDFAARLAGRWAETEPPGLAAFLADAQLRLAGHAKDRTAAAVWDS